MTRAVQGIRRPVFFATIITAVLVVGGEAAWCWRLRGEAQQREVELRQRMRERSEWERTIPLPSVDVTAAIAAELARAEAKLVLCRERFQANLSSEPAETTSWQQQALASQVRVAEECFGDGFGRDASTLPERRVFEQLLAASIAAQPHAVLAWEQVELSSALPDRVGEGAWVRRAFRIRFCGTTEVLRRWLNGINGLNLPLIVRAVEVEPWDMTEVPREVPGAPRAGASSSGVHSVWLREPSVPSREASVLISPELSEFGVTVEWLLLEPLAPEEKAGAVAEREVAS